MEGTPGVYAIYSRKSRFTGKGESVENQVGLCRGYLNAHFGPEAAESAAVYEDEGFSGGTLDRPQFKKMMADSKKTPFRAIVVYRLDRISRSIGDFAGLIEELGRRGIGFISIREQFDTASPMGRAMMYIASVFSQLERETIAERIRDNMRQLARTGRWLGGITPTGYRSERVKNTGPDGRTHALSRLVTDPAEAELVRKIFDLFLTTGSLTKVDTALLERRAATRTGRPFTRVAIRNILTNPVYASADMDAWEYFTRQGAEVCVPRENFDGANGVMAYNRTLQAPGRGTKLRPVSDWIISVGEHRGIVTGERWCAVQSMLERNASAGRRPARSPVALLSGVLRCEKCGGYMRPKLTSRTDADGNPVFTYMCETKERSRGALCTIKNLPGIEADGAMMDALRSIPEDGSVSAILSSMELPPEGVFDGEDQVRALREQLRDNEAAIENTLNALTSASGPAEGYLIERLNRLHSEGETLRCRLLELEERGGEDEGAMLSGLLTFAGALDDCGVEERREVIRALVGRVLWDGETLSIAFRGADGPPCQDSK